MLQRHYTLRTSWERSYTTRSASKYTLTAHQAKAWLHALVCPSEPNTSSSNTCSYNTSFTTASFPYTKSTPNTIRQTYLQNTCNEKCFNGTYMLRAYVRQAIEENPATAVSHTSIRTQQVYTYLQPTWLSISCTRMFTLRGTWSLWYSLTRTWSPHLSLHHSPQGLHDGFHFSSFCSTATPVAMCGTSTFPWMYNMFWADQRLTQYMQLWPWHYIMQARHCPDSCPLMYSMDCCSTQLSSPYTWRRTSMRMNILVHKIHGTSYRPRFQDLQLQLHCQELHPRPPWVHPDLQWWRALQGWICEVHGWILLQFSYNGFWLHVSNSAWIHPSDTILATRCLYINTALRFRSVYRIFEGKVLYRWLMSYMI